MNHISKMEEALQQLVTDSLDLSKRKITGPSGSITVTMDTRALAPDHRIFYRNLHKFRVSQMNDGVDLSDLSDEQWGMVQLDKCHHISTTSTSKDGPQSFRVRICKTCCQEDSHIELGKAPYLSHESKSCFKQLTPPSLFFFLQALTSTKSQRYS